MLCSIATKLGEQDLGEIEALERELGMTILAFSCHPVDPAEADEGQLDRIREVEGRLGVSLVAVKAA
jgi:hypothetical protein